MALTPYNAFPYYQLGEPLTPYLSLSFRGSPAFQYSFPSAQNRIYVERATFNVLDDQGYSTASISLADPDFVNLEVLFLKALFLANSLTIEEGNWYCSAVWGWNSYGTANIYNTGNSGRHFYMLKTLTYDLTDIELRVQLELMDIGYATFGTTAQDGTKGVVVGLLTQTNAYGSFDAQNIALTGTGGNSVQQLINSVYKPVADSANQDLQSGNVPAIASADSNGVSIQYTQPTTSNTNTQQGAAGAQPTYTNTITGKTYWQIIQIVLAAHNITAIARLHGKQEVVPTDAPPSGTSGMVPAESASGVAGAGTAASAVIGQYQIASDASLKDTIETLKTLIKAIDAGPGQPGKHWDILAGGQTFANDNTKPKQNMVWGWKVDPPKGDSTNQTTVGNASTPLLSDNYRLARTFVYRPGHGTQIAYGQTQVLSLKYDWVSRGYLGVGLPAIYGISRDQHGNYQIYTTSDSWRQSLAANPNQTDLLANAKSAQPGVDSFSFSQITKLTGIQVHFNFDTTTMTDDTITTSAGAIIINVWNYFLHEIINIQIEILGDPWLDNTLFLSSGDVSDSNIFVDPFDAYFQVLIYKPGEANGGNVLNPILSGQYMCIKGIRHEISEGEYTTHLELMKPF
jgi:hypothetical protein